MRRDIDIFVKVDRTLPPPLGTWLAGTSLAGSARRAERGGPCIELGTRVYVLSEDLAILERCGLAGGREPGGWLWVRGENGDELLRAERVWSQLP